MLRSCSISVLAGDFFFLISDMVKFPVKPRATMFLSTAYDPITADTIGVPVAGFEDCIIRCHKEPVCEAVLFGSQPDVAGNNCHMYRKRNAK